MRNGRFYFVWAVILILGIVGFIILGVSLNSKSEDKGEEVALQINRQFVDKFFTYSSTGQRYEGIKPLMTEQGYRALFPSGIEMPQDSAVKSLSTNLKEYVLRDPAVQDGQTEILNEFLVSTEFSGIKDSKNVIMRTKLVKDGSTWKINDVEMIIQNTKQ
ncbi:hypothetical protein [Paenibacillus taichungensis]